MSKTIIIYGYGPGISNAVAERFGAEGFSLALVARNAEKLTAAVKAFEAKGIRAAAFPADVSDPAAARAVVAKVREKLGPIAAVEWNAYSGAAGDLLAADAAALQTALNVAVTSLLAAVQEALPDLKQQKDPAVLVINGGLGYFDENVDAMAVQWKASGLAIANAAKHKLVGLLSKQLASDGVYVGEVVVLVSVKGTPFDNGTATLEASTVAAKLWDLYKARGEVSAQVK
ncbi:MAG TPA: SDR family NAD(P)-dependent oxidoreductase [Polyangia bacterium]|nr:SDR family NAD(P)-dependent oxidoreductase [Polyangia bacterium]